MELPTDLLQYMAATSQLAFGPKVVRRSSTLPSKIGHFRGGYTKPTFVQLSNVRNEGYATVHGSLRICCLTPGPTKLDLSASDRRLRKPRLSGDGPCANVLPWR